MNRLVLCLLVTLGGAVPVLAAGPNRHDVAADAKGLLHIDVDAARQTILGRRCQERATKDVRVQAMAAMVEGMSGFNPLKSLHGITVYSKGSPKTGVLVIRADYDKDKVAALLKKMSCCKLEDRGGRATITATHKHHGREHTAHLVLLKNDVAVAGCDLVAVTAACDVIEGKAATLAGSKSPLAADAQKGAVLIARAIDIDTCPHPALKQFKQFSLSIGEVDGNSYYQLAVQARDADVVAKLKTVAEGGLALAQLQHGHDPDRALLIKGTKIAAAENQLSVEWKASTDLLIRVGEKMRDQWIARIKARHPGGAPKPGRGGFQPWKKLEKKPDASKPAEKK